MPFLSFENILYLQYIFCFKTIQLYCLYIYGSNIIYFKYDKFMFLSVYFKIVWEYKACGKEINIKYPFNILVSFIHHRAILSQCLTGIDLYDDNCYFFFHFPTKTRTYSGEWIILILGSRYIHCYMIYSVKLNKQPVKFESA